MRGLIHHLRFFTAVMAVSLSLAGVRAQACTSGAMLDLIGSVEAPEGYNQVYGGVKLSPPAPITTMTVREVLAWQRQASRTAVSSAAGRYQIIRATLDGLVGRGVVSLDDRFSPATQDRLGRALLADAGYRDGATDAGTANRVAGIWAALPRVSGAGRGASVYEGVAGNHALLDADSYMSYMACGMGLDEVTLRSGVVRAGVKIGREVEDMLIAMREQSDRMAGAATDFAQALLWIMLTVQLVLTVGRAMLTDESLETIVASVMFLFPVTLLMLVFVVNFGEILQWIAISATRLSNETLGLEDFSLTTLIRDRVILILRNIEAASAMDYSYLLSVGLVSLMEVVVVALQMGLIVFVYAKVLIVLGGASFLLALGPLQGGMIAARNVLQRLLGSFLELVVINFVLFVCLSLTKNLSAEPEIISRAFVALMLDVLALVLLYALPRSVAKLAIIRGEPA